MKIKFRPHHFLCAVGFVGNGYSPEFIQNFSGIMTILDSETGDATPISVVEFTDSICAPCPHRREKLCESQQKITTLDQAHSKILNIQPGDVLTWGEAKQKIKDNMSLPNFHNACSACEWKSLGVCENALRELIKL